MVKAQKVAGIRRVVIYCDLREIKWELFEHKKKRDAKKRGNHPTEQGGPNPLAVTRIMFLHRVSPYSIQHN